MKYFLLVLLGFVIHHTSFSQEESNFIQGIPEGSVKSMDGSAFSSNDMNNDGDPFMICFWKSCCKSTLSFMDALHDIYPDLEDDYNLKVFAISLDDTRSSSKVRPLINGKGWEFEVLLDENEDFKRAMNVNLTPHYFIYDGKRNLVWQKIGFAEGDEYEIEEILSKIESGETID